MAHEKLNSLAASAFCENMGMMLAAGIATDEAVGLLCEDTAASLFHEAAEALRERLTSGDTLSVAVRGCGYFSEYVSRMIEAGEKAGRTENVLRTLAFYFDGQYRLESKLKSAIVYPSILLVLMTGILAFLQIKVMPVFIGVYESLAGDLAQSSYSYIRIGQTVGWVALAVTLLLSLCLLGGVVASLFEKGRARLVRLLECLPLTRQASWRLALARFVGVLAIFTASGVDTDTAMEDSANMVSHTALQKKLTDCRKRMADGESLAGAIFACGLMEPLYGRMLLVGARSGQLEQVLARLAALFDEDADRQIDRLADMIEPALSGFLTIAVGVTLLAVMLPLIGILGGMG